MSGILDAEKRYGDEAKRLYGVLDQRLVGWEYLAGDYSIADIATWPWISRWPWHRIDWADYPYLKRWYVAIASRPAVQKGWRVPFDAGEGQGCEVRSSLRNPVSRQECGGSAEEAPLRHLHGITPRTVMC